MVFNLNIGSPKFCLYVVGGKRIVATLEQIKSGRIHSSMSFNEKVWTLTARIPRGHVVTYGQIASKLQSCAFRAVGQALHRNPYAPGVPCHRVVGSDGSLTGFSGGLGKKSRLLSWEGVEILSGRVNLDRYNFSL